jgi:hypothetical protein
VRGQLVDLFLDPVVGDEEEAVVVVAGDEEERRLFVRLHVRLHVAAEGKALEAVAALVGLLA